MTSESHWLTSESPASLLYTAKQLKVLKPRKAMLFACGCYRLIWDTFRLRTICEAIEKAEEKADRKVSQKELADYRNPWGKATEGSVDWYLRLSIDSLVTTKMIPTHIAWLVRAALEPSKWKNANKWEDYKPQADLVREVLGNPFHPVTLDRAWLTPTVKALAQTAYDDRVPSDGTLDPDCLAVLADALEDAGCDNADILSHLRGRGAHVRGCWALDLLLGKQ